MYGCKSLGFQKDDGGVCGVLCESFVPRFLSEFFDLDLQKIEHCRDTDEAQRPFKPQLEQNPAFQCHSSFFFDDHLDGTSMKIWQP